MRLGSPSSCLFTSLQRLLHVKKRVSLSDINHDCTHRANKSKPNQTQTPPARNHSLSFSLSLSPHPVGEKRGANPNTNMATTDIAPTLPAALPPERACEKHDGHR